MEVGRLCGDHAAPMSSLMGFSWPGHIEANLQETACEMLQDCARLCVALVLFAFLLVDNCSKAR